MTRKKIEIIAAVSIIVLLVVVLAFILLRKDKVEEPTVVTPTPTVNIPSNVTNGLQERNIPAPQSVSASTVARSFVERFGSYSSESDYVNVDDVKNLATPAFQSELDTLVRQFRSQTDPSDGYTGISTRIITIQPTVETDTNMTFLITTQRQEAIGNPGNASIRYQDVEVELVKSGDSWLINALTWK